MGEDLTTKQLRFAKWYLTHKKNLRTILIVFLVVVNISVWALAVYQFVFYITATESYEIMLKELTKERINYLAMHERFGARDMVINKYNIVYNEKTGYDLIANISNPNQNWRVTNLAYYFTWDGGESLPQKTFVLPGFEKLLFVFERDLDSSPNNLDLIFSDVRWKRVREDIDRLEILKQIKARDIERKYVVAEKELVAFPKILWTVDNQSVYSFWQVDFVVVLYNEGRISGINMFPVKKLMANEKRNVEFRWLNLPKSDEIEMRTDIDIFDTSVFMPVI